MFLIVLILYTAKWKKIIWELKLKEVAVAYRFLEGLRVSTKNQSHKFDSRSMI
jgi:hypothetical protein